MRFGWAYDLLYDDFTPVERARIRTSLERHAALVYDANGAEAGAKTELSTPESRFHSDAGLAITPRSR